MKFISRTWIVEKHINTNFITKVDNLETIKGRKHFTYIPNEKAFSQKLQKKKQVKKRM